MVIFRRRIHQIIQKKRNWQNNERTACSPQSFRLIPCSTLKIKFWVRDDIHILFVKQRLDINCVQIERCHLLGFPVFGHVHTRLIEAPHSVELSRKFHPPPQRCV